MYTVHYNNTVPHYQRCIVGVPDVSLRREVTTQLALLSPSLSLHLVLLSFCGPVPRSSLAAQSCNVVYCASGSRMLCSWRPAG